MQETSLFVHTQHLSKSWILCCTMHSWSSVRCPLACKSLRPCTTEILALLLASSHSNVTFVRSKPSAAASVMAIRMGFLASMACCSALSCVHLCLCVLLLCLFLGCCNVHCLPVASLRSHGLCFGTGGTARHRHCTALDRATGPRSATATRGGTARSATVHWHCQCNHCCSQTRCTYHDIHKTA
jgi:hypothetical protein